MSIQVNPEQMTSQQWLKVLSEVAFGPGLVDIAMFGPDPQCARASSFVRMGLELQDAKGARIFDTVHVLSPPTWPDSVNLQEALMSRLRGDEYPADKVREHAARIAHHKLSRLESLELMEKLRSCPDRSIIYVSSASYFRYSGATEGATEEEAWVTQLVQLARDARASVDGTGSYVLLDTGRFAPIETRNNQLMNDLGCGLVGATGVSETAARLHAIVTGVGKRDARALAETLAAVADAEPLLGPDLASLHRAIAFFNSGRHLAIWPALSPHWESLLEGTSTIPDTRVELARFATAGGMPEEARRALGGFEVALPTWRYWRRSCSSLAHATTEHSRRR